LMPMYGKASQTQIAMIVAFAAQGKATLKLLVSNQRLFDG
jgi:hypothetical protein